MSDLPDKQYQTYTIQEQQQEQRFDDDDLQPNLNAYEQQRKPSLDDNKTVATTVTEAAPIGNDYNQPSFVNWRNNDNYGSTNIVERSADNNTGGGGGRWKIEQQQAGIGLEDQQRSFRSDRSAKDRIAPSAAESTPYKRQSNNPFLP